MKLVRQITSSLARYSRRGPGRGSGAVGMLLAILLIVPGCSSANDPEYARRIAENGKPDLISEQTPTGPRYYGPDLASHRPPRPSEVYYYLNKNKEIYFRQGMAPMVVEIPPTLKDSLVNITKRVQQ